MIGFVIFLGIFSIILSLVLFKVDSGKLKIRDSMRPIVKKIVSKAENFIYFEATKYNPKGDLLPDNIDDNLKQELKKELW